MFFNEWWVIEKLKGTILRSVFKRSQNGHVITNFRPFANLYNSETLWSSGVNIWKHCPFYVNTVVYQRLTHQRLTYFPIFFEIFENLRWWNSQNISYASMSFVGFLLKCVKLWLTTWQILPGSWVAWKIDLSSLSTQSLLFDLRFEFLRNFKNSQFWPIFEFHEYNLNWFFWTMKTSQVFRPVNSLPNGAIGTIGRFFNAWIFLVPSETVRKISKVI